MVKSPFARYVAGGVFTLVLAAVTTMAHGKTWLVETWGSDSLGCGSRVVPCATLSHALTLARKNDRIVVGPGIHFGSLVIDQNAHGPLSGIKLYSAAGRFATRLTPDTAGPMITVAQPNVRVGAKGKGFTIYPLGPGNRGVYTDTNGADRLRIEGNYFRRAEYGILIQGDRVQIRDNIFNEIEFRGISCNACPRGQIRDNQFHTTVDSAQADIYVSQSEGMTIAGNLFFQDTDIGGQAAGILTQGSVKRVTIRDNTFTNVDGIGVSVVNADGARIQGNILYSSGDDAMAIHQLTDDRSPQVRDNLTIFSGGSGILVDVLGNAGITGNTLVKDDSNAIHLATGSLAPDLSRNNIIETRFGCGVTNNTGAGAVVNRLFISGVTPPICNVGVGSQTTLTNPANRPSPLRVNRAAKL